MSEIPDDVESILTDIDEELRQLAVPPHARPFRAIIEFGKRFHISVPLTRSLPPGAPSELVVTLEYSRKIHDWYDDYYGDRLKFDPSANSKVAVIADGDIWEVPLPILYNALVAPSRKLHDPLKGRDGKPLIFNPCASLLGITQARLARFTTADLNEVVLVFNLGFATRAAFKRFREYDPLFAKAEADWSASTLHLTAQLPEFGLSLYSSGQMVEKFMKALINIIGDGDSKKRHDLEKLFQEIEKSVAGISHLKKTLHDIPYTSSARYEYVSDREEAYSAHKASLRLVGELGTIGYGGST